MEDLSTKVIVGSGEVSVAFASFFYCFLSCLTSQKIQQNPQTFDGKFKAELMNVMKKLWEEMKTIVGCNTNRGMWGGLTSLTILFNRFDQPSQAKPHLLMQQLPTWCDHPNSLTLPIPSYAPTSNYHYRRVLQCCRHWM